MSDLPIGKLITTPAERDAIHVAIAPVTAANTLYPGQHINFYGSDRKRVIAAEDSIGIVDPFLTKPVYPDQQFFMFLYPNTVTGMRHHWAHPAFDVENTSDRDIIAEVASICGKSREALIEDAKSFAESGDYEWDNSEGYKDVDSWKEFWVAFEKETGLDPGVECSAPYTCSC